MERSRFVGPSLYSLDRLHSQARGDLDISQPKRCLPRSALRRLQLLPDPFPERLDPAEDIPGTPASLQRCHLTHGRSTPRTLQREPAEDVTEEDQRGCKARSALQSRASLGESRVGQHLSRSDRC